MGRKGKSLTRTFYYLAPAVALAAPAIAGALEPKSGKDRVVTIIARYSGYNMNTGRFSFSDLASGWLPFLGTSLAVKGIQKLNGLIRRI